MSDKQVEIYIKQFTFLEKNQIEKLLELVKDNPPQTRILQRILVELAWFLNYGELKSLKNLLEVRKKKNHKKASQV